MNKPVILRDVPTFADFGVVVDLRFNFSLSITFVITVLLMLFDLVSITDVDGSCVVASQSVQ
jgi:hypothetical protein